jgi:hypothetical protein
LLKAMLNHSAPAKMVLPECVMNLSSKAIQIETLKPESESWNAPPKGEVARRNQIRRLEAAAAMRSAPPPD